MAIDPNLVSIIPASELPTGVPTSAGQFFFYEGDEMKKSPMSEIYGLVSNSQSIGTITPSSTIPTEGNVWGFAGEGTYPNAGNITVAAGKLAILSRVGTTWSKVEVAVLMPNEDFNLLAGKTWVAGLGSPTITEVNANKYLKWNATTGEAVKFAGILQSGKTYVVAFRARNNHKTAPQDAKIAFGSAYSSTESANVKFSKTALNNVNSVWEKVEFTANSADLWIGKIPTTGSNYTTVIDDIIVIEKTPLKEQLLNNQIGLYSSTTRIEASEDIDMSYQWMWENSVGTALSITGGKLNLNLTAGQNQAIKLGYLKSSVYTGKKLKVTLKAKVISGTVGKILVGRFSSFFDSKYMFEIQPTTTEQIFTGEIFIEPYNTIETQFNIGALAANNTGGVVEIDDVVIEYAPIVATSTIDYSKIIYNNADGIFSSLNTSNPHNDIFVIGDSLTANPIGGVIPNIEPLVSRRPFRMTTANNYPRRIYDKYCFNKPNWRRLDDTDWVKTGVWNSVNDTTLFEPIHTNDRYDRTVEASATAEFSIPDGDEYLVLIMKEENGYGTLNFQINGVAPTSQQGVSSYNCNYANAGHTGNPYKKLMWKLPTGTGRKFKIVKDATTNPVMVWGGYSWKGSTLIVTPIAHGGHTLADLQNQHYQDEYVRNKSMISAVIFEVTEMNDTRTATIEQIVSNLQTWITNLNDKDVLFTTCNILGTDPTDGTPNYYVTTQTNGFTQKQMNDAVKKYIIDKNLPFIDLFTVFERATAAKGGTIENGDAGLYWTHDGQHGNEAGVTLWFQSLTSVLNGMPVFCSTI